MTSLDKDGVTVPGIGRQAQSSRKSAPSYGISKVGRGSTDAVYISEDHIRTAKIGRQSPPGGPVYDLPSTMNGIGTKFGKPPPSGRSRIVLSDKAPDDPDDIPSNDALGVDVDTQRVKYRREPEIIIGTDPRGKLKDAELIKNHTAAFYGRSSPGPAAIGGTYGPSVGPTKPSNSSAQPFGIKTKTTWMKFGDNPPNVGPGTHERRDVSMGKQHLTQRRNQNVHGFAKSDKFPKDRYQDSISVLDAARSSFGRQVLGKKKSEPSINFSADSRKSREKMMVCFTKSDVGPKANMPKFTASMPQLPMEKHIMKSGLG